MGRTMLKHSVKLCAPPSVICYISRSNCISL